VAVLISMRNLFESRARFLMSVGGVALAILLILVLDGVFAGALKQVTAYMDNGDYSIMVSQKGVKNLHMTTSFFPASKVQQIRQVKGVKSADPILYSADYLVKGNNRSLSYVIGFIPGKPGGPWTMAEGTTRIKSGQIIIDERIAEKYDLDVGDKIGTLGRPFTIGSLTKATVNITNAISFIRFDDFQRIRNTPGIVSYALVRVEKGQSVSGVIRRIRQKVKGVTVLTRQGFASSERQAISDMSVDIMRLMNSVAFLIGLAALGLTVYTSTLSKLREYGILKAIGSKNRKLMSIVFQQAIISTLIGLAIAIVFAFLIRYALVLSGSNILIVIGTPSIFKVLIGATIINLLSSSIPILRIAGLDPAEVFRR